MQGRGSGESHAETDCRSRTCCRNNRRAADYGHAGGNSARQPAQNPAPDVAANWLSVVGELEAGKCADAVSTSSDRITIDMVKTLMVLFSFLNMGVGEPATEPARNLSRFVKQQSLSVPGRKQLAPGEAQFAACRIEDQNMAGLHFFYYHEMVSPQEQDGGHRD